MKAQDPIYEQLARVGQALSSSSRVALLDLLRQGPRTVESLSRVVGLSLANTSQHLKVLRQAGLVESEKQGVHVTYRVSGPIVDDFYRGLRALAEAQLAEVQQIVRAFVAKRGGLEPVDTRQLLARVRAGEVAVLDVRPVEEYRAGHIPGAVSVPLVELQERLRKLPKDRDIVAYCRGPYCLLAPQAVTFLRARGRRAFAMGDGVAEWRARGLPVSVGEAP